MVAAHQIQSDFDSVREALRAHDVLVNEAIDARDTLRWMESEGFDREETEAASIYVAKARSAVSSHSQLMGNQLGLGSTPG